MPRHRLRRFFSYPKHYRRTTEYVGSLSFGWMTSLSDIKLEDENHPNRPQGPEDLCLQFSVPFLGMGKFHSFDTEPQ